MRKEAEPKRRRCGKKKERKHNLVSYSVSVATYRIKKGISLRLYNFNREEEQSDKKKVMTVQNWETRKGNWHR